MAKWFPLHSHSHYSLLDGLSKPAQIAGRLVECGYAGSALTDHGTIAGAASFVKAMKETCQCGHRKQQHSATRCVAQGCTCQGFEKANLLALLGCEFYICQKDAAIRDQSNRSLSHLCVLARNQSGWRHLIQASSASNRPEFAYYKPRLDLERLAAYGQGQFIAFSGHIGSDMANIFFEDPKAAYRAETEDAARDYVRKDRARAAIALACHYRDLFGKENFWLEINQPKTGPSGIMPAALVVAKGLRYVSKQTGIPCVATADSHYPRRDDAYDQRILVCSALETTLDEVTRKIAAGEDVTLQAFFDSKDFHIPSEDEMEGLYTAEELKASLEIAERCESFDILGKPILPEFPCPDGLTGDEYMRRLCKEGWQRKITPRLKDGKVWTERANSVDPDLAGDLVSFTESEYRERLEKELGVIFGAGLSGYFLIVQDYCQYAHSKGKVGKGRGSAAGCLASYLVGITDVDPLAYGLIFERFYNAGRNSPGRVALPDIDCDFEKTKRSDVIRYVRARFGESRVAQMATYTRMQGRGALKDVLRANNACTFEEMNRITEHIPDEAAIADQLQEMMEETGEASIIRWALENDADSLKDWVRLTEDGQIDRDYEYGRHFEQAIRLEGTFRSLGKHPSGVIISPVDLADIVPIGHDKTTEEPFVLVDMRDAEALGLVKLDILGTTVLDKIRGAVELVRTGRISA